jgi:Cof subfamily protein (haloacid dehalogenase superfamily)
MMIRMILTDLDHTLLKQDGSVSGKTLQILTACRAKGIRFAIATARYWIGAERYIDLLNPDYEITTDGTLVHSHGQCIYSCAFSVSETNAIISGIAEAVPGAEITAACGKTVYWNSDHISESEKLHKAVYCDYSSPLDVQANKIVAELPDESVAREIAARTNCKLQCYRGEKWYAFMPAASGKTAAIRALAEISGISPEDTVAFGDDLNDIEMLRFCGTGIAVANAIPELQEAADEITLSNDEDGVAKWLADHCLKEIMTR